MLSRCCLIIFTNLEILNFNLTFLLRLGPLTFLLRVTNPRTRALALARSVWIIAGFPMFVTPWSSEFSPEESQLTSAVVPVELRGVKENFEVAKLWVHVNLLTELPKRIVTGF
ncbi:BnaC03g48930D [Brassica napus]|uniref:(rape) hypothetical protein n=1 Tax=Brassica napus TaxID=3708 RepID=A0A078FNB3_BRANA|nr:unnamed protein product [Brassica napus]CDY14566.1 BnaC03g48930D [Brassica napus]